MNDDESWAKIRYHKVNIWKSFFLFLGFVFVCLCVCLCVICVVLSLVGLSVSGSFNFY